MKKTTLMLLVLTFSLQVWSVSPECIDIMTQYQELEDKHHEIATLLLNSVKEASDDFYSDYNVCVNRQSNCANNLYVHHGDYRGIAGVNRVQLKSLNEEMQKVKLNLINCLK